ncbi:MAG: hypothetical protein ACRDYZ_16555 [Acidimicrobiales bacterium]
MRRRYTGDPTARAARRNTDRKSTGRLAQFALAVVYDGDTFLDVIDELAQQTWTIAVGWV